MPVPAQFSEKNEVVVTRFDIKIKILPQTIILQNKTTVILTQSRLEALI